MNEIFARIRWGLVGWNLLVLAAILLLLGSAVYAAMSSTLMAETDRNLAARAEAVIHDLEEEDHQERLHLDEEDSYDGGFFYLLVGPGGQTISNPQRLNLVSGSLRVSTGGPAHYENATVAGEPLRLYVWPLPRSRQGELALVVGQSVEVQRATLSRLLLVILAGGGAGLALSLAGAWFLAGRALLPIQLAFRRQQQFVADASHELRTPLTVLHAATDLLHRHRMEPLDADFRLLDDVRREIARMERLVADLLTLARSDLGEMDLATGQLDLGVLADDVVRLIGPMAENKGVHLVRQGDGASLVVEGDPDRLQQVLLILLDNAIEHTSPSGKVIVTSRQRGSSACIEVRDSGRGIAPEHLPRVFDRFYRVDKARSRAYGGAGLGLSIAKSIVDGHKGQLSLDSAVNSGTTARLCLPMSDE